MHNYICTVCTLCYLTVVLCDLGPELSDFTAVPGFRDIQLKWALDSPEDTWALGSTVSAKPARFRVRYCENQVWGEHLCKRKVLRQPSENGYYSLNLPDLKMATEYTVYLSHINNKNKGISGKSRYRKQYRKRDRKVTEEEQLAETVLKVETLGFSAKASDCGPKHTVVDVQTGPGFSGKITAEGASDPSCSIQGEEGLHDSYTLTLNHETCRSEVNQTAAWTYILVQENLPILTHSTRRFLVLCKFDIPDVFTVKSGLSLPYAKTVSRPSGGDPDRGARNLKDDASIEAFDTNIQRIITLEDYIDTDTQTDFGGFFSPDLDIGGSNMAASSEQTDSIRLSNLVRDNRFAGERKYRTSSDDQDVTGDETIKEVTIVLVLSVVVSLILIFTIGYLSSGKSGKESETDRKCLQEKKKRRESVA